MIVCLSRRNSGCQVQRGGDQGDGKVGEWWFKSETCQRIKEMDMLPMIRVNTETLKAVVKCNEFIFCWELKPFPNWIVHLKLWISKICKDVRESWGDRLSPGSCPSKSQLVTWFLQPEHVSLEILLFQASQKFLIRQFKNIRFFPTLVQRQPWFADCNHSTNQFVLGSVSRT